MAAARPFGHQRSGRQAGLFFEEREMSMPTISAVDAEHVYVLGSNGTLWLDQGPFGNTVPPTRQQVNTGALAGGALDGNLACGALGANSVYVLANDGNLWLGASPFGTNTTYEHVDSNAVGCAVVDENTVYVLGSDGNLWLEKGPFQFIDPNTGEVLTDDTSRDQGPRWYVQVDSNVIGCAAVDENTVYVIGSDGNLWLEQAPFGTIPPARIHVDSNVIGCAAVDANTVYVVGSDGNLWLEQAPFGTTLPPVRTHVDSNVVGCAAVDDTNVYVLGYDGNLWLENGPFGTIPPSRTLVDGNVFLPRFQRRTHDLVVDIRDFGARLDGRSISDGAMTAGLPGFLSQVLTSATYAFQPSDLGKLVVVQFAGPSDNGYAAPLTSTITDLFEGVGAVLQDPASTSTMPTSILETAPGPTPITITAVIPGKPTVIQVNQILPPQAYVDGDQVWIDGTGVVGIDAAGNTVPLDQRVFEISSVNATSTQFTVPLDTSQATVPGGGAGIVANTTIHIKTVTAVNGNTLIWTVYPHWFSPADHVTINGTGLLMLDELTFRIGVDSNLNFSVPVVFTSGSTTGTVTSNTIHVTTTGAHGLVTGMTVKIPSIHLVDQGGSAVDGEQVQYVSDNEFAVAGQIAVAVDGSVGDASVSGTGSRVDWGTDDLQAWTDAIAAASAVGAYSATVHAGPGTSLVSNTIIVDESAGAAGITISGAGPGGQFAQTGTHVILAAPPEPPRGLSATALADWLPSLVDWKTVNAKLENLWLDGANIAPLKDDKPVPLDTLLLEYLTSSCLFERLLISGATVDKGAARWGSLGQPDASGGAEIHIYGPDPATDEIDTLRFHLVSILHDPDHEGTPAKSRANVLLDGDAQAFGINFELIITRDGAWGFILAAGGVNIDHAQIYGNSAGMISYEPVQLSRWNDIYTEQNLGVPFLEEQNVAANDGQPIVVSNCRIADHCAIIAGCKQPLILIGNSLGGDVIIEPAAPPLPVRSLPLTDLLTGSATVTFPPNTDFPGGLGLQFSTQTQAIYALAGRVNESTGYVGTLTTPYTGPSAAAATAAVVLLATATVRKSSTAVTFSAPQTLLAGTVLTFLVEPLIDPHTKLPITHAIARPVTASTSVTLTAPYQGDDADATAVTAQQPIGVYQVADHGTVFSLGNDFIGDLTHLEQFGSQLPLTTDPVWGYVSSVEVTARFTNVTTQQVLTVGGSEAQHTTILQDTAAYTCDTTPDAFGNIVPDRVVAVELPSSGIQITLPAPSMGRVLTFVDFTGQASTVAPIELLPHDGETINGTASARMTTNWGSVTVRSPNGVNWVAEQPPLPAGNASPGSH